MVFVKQSWFISLVFFIFCQPVFGASEEKNNNIIMKLPAELVNLGFDKFLFSRFKFRSQISIRSSTLEDIIDAELGVIDSGIEVFSDLNGVAYRLRVVTDDAVLKEKLNKFETWLLRGPGADVIEDFSFDGVPLFVKMPEVVQEIEEIQLSGNVRKGKELARVHCKRCHVVDDNAYSGIGSTPSFHAMKSRASWFERFSAFWTVNPHVSIISVEDLFEAGSDNSPVPIVPVNLRLEDIDDILAYVNSIEAKDLGSPIGSW